MSKLKTLFRQLLHNVDSKWLFVIPSLVLLALLALPLLALFVRSFNPDFFSNAFSEQAFKALRLSLITSTITTGVAILFGTQFAYMLARWKFRLKAWIELFIEDRKSTRLNSSH